MPLNLAQRDAVTTLSGPLLVLAGAGTGKTRVVTARIAELIRRGTKPERILAVTFTNKAATEMRERAMALLGKPKRSRGRGQPGVRRAASPEISTFHSLCVRVLRRHAATLGYPTRFAICDRGDQETIARAALREIRAPEQALRPGDLCHFIGRWKSHGIRPRQASSLAETDREHLAAVGYRRYQQTLKSRGMVDFDDLLLLVEELLCKHADVRRAEADRFDHILIDEYQDTNTSQYQIVRRLAAQHRSLCVVGDDDQSIYGWRGAEVEHILRFKDDWPDAKIVRLEQNYRSSEAVLQYANTLITFNKTRHEKTLRANQKGGQRPRILQFPDENQEAEQIVRDVAGVLASKTAQAKDIAILCRTNEQPRPFEAALRQADIPYVLIGAMSFFDRREIRDLLAYLKMLVDPTDEPSLLRILNCPPRGIGRGTQEQIVRTAVERGTSAWEVITDPSGRSIIGPKAAAAVDRFRATVLDLTAATERKTPSQLIRYILDQTGYEDVLVRNYAEPLERDARTAALEDLIRAAAAYERSSPRNRTDGKRAKKSALPDFLAHLALNQRDDGDKEDQLRGNAVALMTLHSAKGLEFPHVYLVGMEEGILPHKKSIEADGAAIDEERRLCYVGVTRAKERLTLSLALSRRKWGKPRDTIPSRYLYEMTGQAENWIAMQRERGAPQRSKRRPGHRPSAQR